MHARLRSIQDTIATEAQTAEAVQRAHVLLEQQHAKVQQELLQERQARQRAEHVMLEMHLRRAPPPVQRYDTRTQYCKYKYFTVRSPAVGRCRRQTLCCASTVMHLNA